jgi:hypothetical protein
MNGNIQAGGAVMVNDNRQLSLGGTFSATSITMLIAGLLILLGIVFQLGELGYGHINGHSLWFVSMVTESAWNLFSLHGYGPAFDELLRWWPLALVSIGVSILMLQRGRS